MLEWNTKLESLSVPASTFQKQEEFRYRRRHRKKQRAKRKGDLLRLYISLTI